MAWSVGVSRNRFAELTAESDRSSCSPASRQTSMDLGFRLSWLPEKASVLSCGGLSIITSWDTILPLRRFWPFWAPHSPEVAGWQWRQPRSSLLICIWPETSWALVGLMVTIGRFPTGTPFPKEVFRGRVNGRSTPGQTSRSRSSCSLQRWSWHGSAAIRQSACFLVGQTEPSSARYIGDFRVEVPSD